MSSYYYTGCSEPYEPHFLESCNLCSKPLGFNSDIFMYKGNTPFCSKECRQEQIDVDEANERKGWKSSSSSRSHRKSEQSAKKDSAPSSTVAVA